VEMGVDGCMGGWPDKMGSYQSFSRLHSTQDLRITIGTSLEVGNCEARWGIDNVELWYR
jgi:hypothetical protein